MKRQSIYTEKEVIDFGVYMTGVKNKASIEKYLYNFNKFEKDVNNSFESKTKKVVQHLIKYGQITSWDAITKYKATRLSAIIFNLKEKGFIFLTVIEKNKNSWYARYYYKGTKEKAKLFIKK